MSYYHYLMVVEIAFLIINMLVLRKYKEEITYWKWIDIYFWIHKIFTALPSIVFAWAGYIFLYDYFNSYTYYKTIYMKELPLLSGYFVLVILLCYLGENSRKIYTFVRTALFALNLCTCYCLIKFQDIIMNWADVRNVFMNGQKAGYFIIGAWLLIDIMNCYEFIRYYKYNRYEMTD